MPPGRPCGYNLPATNCCVRTTYSSKHNTLLKQRTLAPDMAVTMYVSSPTRVGSSRSVVCRNQRYQAPFPPSAPLRYHTTSAENSLPEHDHT